MCPSTGREKVIKMLIPERLAFAGGICFQIFIFQREHFTQKQKKEATTLQRRFKNAYFICLLMYYYIYFI